MEIQSFAKNDLNLITELQPAGWEIFPSFEFYTRSECCAPIKITINHKIVGVGSTIINNDTAWLGHIIVHPEHRNQGIGQLITQTLVDSARSKNCETIYLIATEMGEPVYKKIGFETETEYLMYKNIQPNANFMHPVNVVGYTIDFYEQLSLLDRLVSGENRLFQLEEYLSSGFVYVRHNEVGGFYLPTFRDGLIIATTVYAGHELMKLRLQTKEIASFPIDNLNASAFMRQHKFNVSMTQKRMRLGKKRDWQPANIYNRVAGNFG